VKELSKGIPNEQLFENRYLSEDNGWKASGAAAKSHLFEMGFSLFLKYYPKLFFIYVNH